MTRTPRFDEEDVTAAGLRVLRRDGWSSISVRAVAAELGVSPMALYRIAPDADQLRALVADGAATHLGVAADLSLHAALRDWAVQAHRLLGRHHGLAAHLTAGWTELPRWLDQVEALLARVATAGLSGAEAVATVNAVFAYVLARAQLRDSVVGRRRLAPLRADPSRYPHLLANRHEYVTARTDHHFGVGLDALLGGLDRRWDAEPAGAAPATPRP